MSNEYPFRLSETFNNDRLLHTHESKGASQIIFEKADSIYGFLSDEFLDCDVTNRDDCVQLISKIIWTIKNERNV